jgi:hypothetical protein
MGVQRRKKEAQGKQQLSTADRCSETRINGGGRQGRSRLGRKAKISEEIQAFVAIVLNYIYSDSQETTTRAPLAQSVERETLKQDLQDQRSNLKAAGSTVSRIKAPKKDLTRVQSPREANGSTNNFLPCRRHRSFFHPCGSQRRTDYSARPLGSGMLALRSRAGTRPIC